MSSNRYSFTKFQCNEFAKWWGQVTTAWLYLGIGLTTLLSPINTLPFKCWEVPGGIKAKYIYNSSVNHNIFGLKRSYKVMFLAAWNTALSFCKSKQTFHELKTRFAKKDISRNVYRATTEWSKICSKALLSPYSPILCTHYYAQNFGVGKTKSFQWAKTLSAFWGAVKSWIPTQSNWTQISLNFSLS